MPVVAVAFDGKFACRTGHHEVDAPAVRVDLRIDVEAARHDVEIDALLEEAVERCVFLVAGHSVRHGFGGRRRRGLHVGEQ